MVSLSESLEDLYERQKKPPAMKAARRIAATPRTGSREDFGVAADCWCPSLEAVENGTEPERGVVVPVGAVWTASAIEDAGLNPGAAVTSEGRAAEWPESVSRLRRLSSARRSEAC